MSFGCATNMRRASCHSCAQFRAYICCVTLLLYASFGHASKTTPTTTAKGLVSSSSPSAASVLTSGATTIKQTGALVSSEAIADANSNKNETLPVASVNIAAEAVAAAAEGSVLPSPTPTPIPAAAATVALAQGAVSSAPVAQAAIPTTTRRPLLQGIRLPCSCIASQCGCCSGMILERFKQKACMNLTYDADDFAITAAMSMNERVLYKNTISGKNPDPMCIRVPRFRFIDFCVEFSNIYLAKRNLHMCIDAQASWQDFTLVEWSFDCVRLGASGFSVLRPEDGGGLALPGDDEEDQVDEDYDDSARNEPLPTSPQPGDKFSVEKLPTGFVRIRFNKV